MLWFQAAEEVEIPPFDFLGFMADHWWEYILIFLFISYIYNKVFRTRKLPLLKAAIVYGIIAIGSFVLLILQVDAGLPILLCLAIALGLMLVVRIRYFLIERKQANNASTTSDQD